MEPIAARIEQVRERMAAAARRAGRSPEDIRLVGVSKTHPPELLAQALAAGLHDFGENRVQEADAKIDALAAERASITWHLIGHLQGNKAKRAVALFDLVHSLDSAALAETLDRQAALHDRAALPVLLQVNVSGEASKEGFALGDWEAQPALLEAFFEQVAALLALPHLSIGGLMTIAPWGADAEAARPTFRSARQLRDALAQRFPANDWSALSMGMTGDFEVAIEEGATLVRVGRAIFGDR